MVWRLIYRNSRQMSSKSIWIANAVSIISCSRREYLAIPLQPPELKIKQSERLLKRGEKVCKTVHAIAERSISIRVITLNSRILFGASVVTFALYWRTYQWNAALLLWVIKCTWETHIIYPHTCSRLLVIAFLQIFFFFFFIHVIRLTKTTISFLIL